MGNEKNPSEGVYLRAFCWHEINKNKNDVNKTKVKLTDWMEKTMKNSNVNLLKVWCIKRLRLPLSAAAKVSVGLAPLVHS